MDAKPYIPHIEDVENHYWFPPYDGVRPRNYDLLSKDEAMKEFIQFRAFFYPQSAKQLDVLLDYNNLWSQDGLSANAKLLGPLLVVKYSPLYKKPIDLDVEDALLVKALCTSVLYDTDREIFPKIECYRNGEGKMEAEETH
ncbi:hypothetical protein MPER_16024 [Moniliophthora perniciosa FA553]|nr:hypothetical protein MPER_16024 [Moniliophthora perniciosa FA553]